MKIAAARALVRLLALLPLAFVRALARGLGVLSGVIPWRGHRRLDENLRRAFPDLGPAQLRRLAGRNRAELLATVLDHRG